MSDQSKKPEVSNEQRYMALLALTSQTLPSKAGDETDPNGADVKKSSTEKLYDELDANPAALEAFLRRERKKVAPTRQSEETWMMRLASVLMGGPGLRYAAAFGVATFVSILVVMQIGKQESLLAAVENTYMLESAALNESLVMPQLIMPWERTERPVGFSTENRTETPAIIEFGQGLQRGRQLLRSNSSDAPEANHRSASFALGEWNVLLWAAAENGRQASQEYWKRQHAIADRFQKAEFDAASGDEIANHLQRVNELLTALQSNQTPARSARSLADELLLFRERFAPHDAEFLSPKATNAANDGKPER